jgi:hypothetical protein
VAVGQGALGEIAVRAADEVVRLADRGRHDPLAGRRRARAGRDAGDDVLVRDGVGEVDERRGETPKCMRCASTSLA